MYLYLAVLAHIYIVLAKQYNTDILRKIYLPDKYSAKHPALEAIQLYSYIHVEKGCKYLKDTAQYTLYWGRYSRFISVLYCIGLQIQYKSIGKGVLAILDTSIVLDWLQRCYHPAAIPN